VFARDYERVKPQLAYPGADGGRDLARSGRRRLALRGN
jgi:hypothetical protein